MTPEASAQGREKNGLRQLLLMNTDKIEETVLFQPIQRFGPFNNIKDEQNSKLFNQI